MSPSDSSDRLRGLARVWADALSYALAVAAFATIGALIVGIATGGGAVRGKLLLFGIGWLLLAYTTVRLWPTSPEDVESPSRGYGGDSLSPRTPSTRFQRLARALPPARWTRPPVPERRLTLPGKQLLASLLILFASFLLETVFGVA